MHRASQVVLAVRNLPANAGDLRDTGSIPELGKSRGGGHGNPLQCSCLENPRDGGAWWAAVCGVAQSQTRLKRLSSSSSIYTYIHIMEKNMKRYVYVSILFHILFHYGLLQDIECSSQCCAVGPCCLSIL